MKEDILNMSEEQLNIKCAEFMGYKIECIKEVNYIVNEFRNNTYEYSYISEYSKSLDLMYRVEEYLFYWLESNHKSLGEYTASLEIIFKSYKDSHCMTDYIHASALDRLKAVLLTIEEGEYPGCSELVNSGYCDKHKKQSAEYRRGSAHQRGYNYKWSQYSKRFLKNMCPSCHLFRTQSKSIGKTRCKCNYCGDEFVLGVPYLCLDCIFFNEKLTDDGYRYFCVNDDEDYNEELNICEQYMNENEFSIEEGE